MKIPVDIRADKEFIKVVESLILQKINELIKSEFDLRKYIEVIVEKYVKRRQEDLILDSIKTYMANVKMRTQEKTRYGYSMREQDIPTYIRTMVKRHAEAVIAGEVKKLMSEIQIVMK